MLEARDKEPNLSDQQLIDKARHVGLTKSKNRQRAMEIYNNAVTKRNLYKQMDTSSNEE